jgi:hypothetical protein
MQTDLLSAIVPSELRAVHRRFEQCRRTRAGARISDTSGHSVIDCFAFDVPPTNFRE